MPARFLLPAIVSRLHRPMPDFPMDIIVPVWNHPDRTRACLASLVATAPEARLVLVNNGCDGPTEELLGEFAERLDDRALLLGNPVTVDLVTALNRGLALATAPLVGVVRNGLVLPAGWLEPLERLMAADATAAGVIPRFSPAESCSVECGAVTEVDHGSFTVMVLRRELLQRLGGYDADLAEPLWCLRDLARRCTRAGYRLLQEPSVTIAAPAEVPLGSPARRAERAAVSRDRFLARWGEPRAFALVPDSAALPPEAVPAIIPLLVRGSRQGHRFHLLAGKRLCRELAERLGSQRHANIVLEGLPLLGGSRFIARRLEELSRESPGLAVVGEGTAAGGLPALSLAGLTGFVAETEERYYATGAEPGQAEQPVSDYSR